MTMKKWLIGASVSLFYSLLVAGAGLVAGMQVHGFIAVFCAAAATHFSAYLMKHPVESIVETTTASRIDTDPISGKTTSQELKTVTETPVTQPKDKTE